MLSRSKTKLFGSLLVWALGFSLILHYLFINYFPLEWFDRLLLNEQGAGAQQFKISSNIDVTLEGEVSEKPASGTGKGSGEGESDGESGLDSLDAEKWGELLERLEENTGFTHNFEESYAEVDENSPTSKSYIHRERFHEDIVVKEVFPTIYDIKQPFEEVLDAAPEIFADYQERNEIIERYRQQKGNDIQLLVELNLNQNAENLGPLSFSAEERRKFFDSTLKQNKEEQLSNFIRKYFSYDPNEGDLPASTRELYYENLERILYTFSSDASYYYLDFYLENLNKEDFLNTALSQAARLDGTKTATELLLVLERIYEIQQRAWRVHFDFDRLYSNLPEEKKSYLRLETLRRVYERYNKELERQGIKDYAEIQSLYFERRFQILDYVVEHTPESYRKRDAIFERAIVLWEMGLALNKPDLQIRAVNDWQLLILEAEQVDYSPERFEDFQNLKHLKHLDALLTAYQDPRQQARRKMREQQISALLRNRQLDRLNAKRERELRLLWPSEAK